MKIPILSDIERVIRRLIKGEKNPFEGFMKSPDKYQLSFVCIDISNFCNSACPFCSRTMSEHKLSGFMKKEMFYDIMHQLEKIKTVQTISLGAWGEPMMHPDFDEFVDYIKQKGYHLLMPSNFSLAAKHFDALLKFDEITFSIEGHDKESYEFLRKNLNFETTYNNVVEFDRLVKEHRQKGLPTPTRTINYILSKKSDVKKFIALWEPYVDKINIGRIGGGMAWDNKNKQIEILSNNELSDIMLPVKRMEGKKYCAHPFCFSAIKPNGKIALCCSDYNFDLNLGDYKNIAKNFQKNRTLNKIRKEFEKGKLDICKNCDMWYCITKEELFKYFPELEEVEKLEKVQILAE